ncbi:MAG: hypothetical protein KDD94_00080 [Calditrichaeota bacterium]|nr:hypothetical protein [Calditrichota bacterium]
MPKLNILNSLILLLISTYLVHERFTDEHVQFQEISVERLNVVGKDGNKYVVISSPERQALPTIDGKPTDPNKTERPVPGLLFFNSEGDEIGGLIYDISPTNSFQ